jgi:bifunctional DNA primase/polymerase-like protein
MINRTSAVPDAGTAAAHYPPTTVVNPPEPPDGPLVEHALAYAAIDWPVFPLAPRSKVPLYANPHRAGTPERANCRGRLACGRDGHGVLDATCDPETITAWWARTPSANIGLACGTTAAGDGPDVVDFDVKAGAPGRASFELLRDEGWLRGAFATVATPTGGWHLYYAGSTQGNGVCRGFGVDFRSAGGYVVAPPSPTAVGAYTWTWGPTITDTGVSWSAIRDRLKPPPPPVDPLVREVSASAAHLVDWLAGQGPGSENRNNALYWACCQALEGGYGTDVLDELTTVAAANGLEAAEIRKTRDSALRHVLRAGKAGAR